MEFLRLIHYLILLFLISMPLLPINILRHIYFIPVIIPLLWVLFGSCPLTMAHGQNGDSESFTQSIYKHIYPNTTIYHTHSLNTLILVAIICLSTRKLIHKPDAYINEIMIV
jgi:hypothetical protein